jgi:hypothetical protein
VLVELMEELHLAVPSVLPLEASTWNWIPPLLSNYSFCELDALHNTYNFTPKAYPLVSMCNSATYLLKYVNSTCGNT